MDKNVFLSLLSLDSYNRIYGRRIKLDGREGGAQKIGDAAIQGFDENLRASWTSEGFYASACRQTHREHLVTSLGRELINLLALEAS